MVTVTRSRLLVASLLHYWRTNLAVLFGVIAGTSVIGGALIVGDSVKASLRQMTLDRLGQIDFALSGPRFVTEQMANRLNSKPTSSVGPFCPAILMRAALEAKSGDAIRRAGGVNVYGVDDRAWSLITTSGTKVPAEGQLVLSQSAAAAINAKVGDSVTLWIELPSLVPRDTLMGKKDNDSQEITVTLAAIAPETNGLSKLGLQPTQAMPLNAFVGLHFLQDQLDLAEVKPSKRDPIGKPARINAIFARDNRPNALQAEMLKGGDVDRSRLTSMIRQSWTLADLNLRILDNQLFNGIVVESDQMILEDKLAQQAQAIAQEMQLATSPVMVYLANKLWNPDVYQPGKRPGYSMYSTVAGLDIPDLAGTPFEGFEFVGEAPTSWGEDDVIINEFLATDLQVRVGQSFKFTYHVVGSRGELPELERTVTVRGIVKMTAAAIDRTLTPEVKGITDVDSLADWDQPFPMDLDAVTPRDDEYWDSYRAIPKVFMPLATAKKLWPSRYGSLTSIRMAPKTVVTQPNDVAAKRLKDEFASKLLNQIDPAEVGLMFQPVKAFGLKAAGGSTDFSQLFAGFSLFLIVAAMILIGLLFRLGVEQRIRSLGLLGAVGFSPRAVRRLLILEGGMNALVGGLLGTFVAVAYASVMVYGLTHWWIGATGTKDLFVSISPISLSIGWSIAVLSALFSIWWALWQLSWLSIREQLAGVTERVIDAAAQHKRKRRLIHRTIICLVLSAVLLACAGMGLIPAAAAFGGIGTLLLVASLSALSAWLLTETGLSLRGNGVRGLGVLGMRNASRARQRTVMSVGMIATATFLIVTVAAFRRDPTGELPVKTSGNGGYTLVAESSSPVLYDINTAEGRKKLQLSAPADSPAGKSLTSMNVVPFRVKPGEDASCLNLYQTRVPTILGAPKAFMEEGRFAFASGSWRELLDHPKATSNTDNSSTGQPIPVLGDMNTLMFSLHKQVGQTIALPNDENPQHQLMIKGMFQDSVFQGVLVMSEENFLKLFPEQKGYRYFLIDVPLQDAPAATTLLETELAEYGFDAEPVADRLARFLSVQNTYLSTFQTLGGLGLLLGTFGLATVMLRNVLERQSELALLRAVGYREQSIALLVFWENAFILLWGLVAGTASALLSASPNLISRGADLPWGSLLGLLTLVFATGMVSSAFAVRAAVRLPIVATLRGE